MRPQPLLQSSTSPSAATTSPISLTVTSCRGGRISGFEDVFYELVVKIYDSPTSSCEYRILRRHSVIARLSATLTGKTLSSRYAFDPVAACNAILRSVPYGDDESVVAQFFERPRALELRRLLPAAQRLQAVARGVLTRQRQRRLRQQPVLAQAVTPLKKRATDVSLRSGGAVAVAIVSALLHCTAHGGGASGSSEWPSPPMPSQLDSFDNSSAAAREDGAAAVCSSVHSSMQRACSRLRTAGEAGVVLEPISAACEAVMLACKPRLSLSEIQ